MVLTLLRLLLSQLKNARLEGFEPPTFWSVARRSIRAELEALIENRSVRSSVRMLKLNNVVWRRGWDSNPRTA